MPTYRELVETYLRDHEGYLGDGKGGRGALPMGDMTTASRPISKRDLRELFLAWDGGATLPDPQLEDPVDVATLLSNATLSYGAGATQVQAGDIIRTRAEGVSYRVAASGATDHHRTAGSVKLYVLPGVTGYNALAFGPPGAAAINAAIAAAQASGGARGTIDVWVPGGDYNLGAETITIPIGVGFVAAAGARFIYTGSGVAIDAYGNGQTGTRRLFLPNVEKPTVNGAQPQWDAGTDTSSTGIRLNALHYEQVHLRAIRGFHTGLELKALPQLAGGGSQNIVCNTIHLGQCVNNRRGILFTNNTVGTAQGANQNVLIGGSIRIDSGWTTVGSRYGVYMPHQETNGNTFVGTNLEDFSGAADTEIAIYCNSTNNVFMNTRFENGGPGSIQFGPTGVNNTLICSLDDPTVDGPFEAIVQDGGFGNKYITGDVIASKRFKLDFNTGRVFFGGGVAVPSYRVEGYGTDRLQLGQSGARGVRYFGAMQQEMVEVTSGNVWPEAANFVALKYTNPELNITGSASPGTDTMRHVAVLSVNGNTRLKHNPTPTAGRMFLKGGVDIDMTAGQVVSFMLYAGVYYQI